MRRRVGRASGVVLTREWLLGVRRGWLSLLHPKIEGWSDVFRAFDRLQAFVDNLSEQIRYERPAPAFVVSALAERRAAILDAFATLREKLKELRDYAKWAYDAAHGQMPFPSEQLRADGERALALYKKDFGAMLETHVPQRVNVTRGRYNPTKMGHLTFYVDKVLELLRQEAATIARSAEVSPEETRERFAGAPTAFDIGRVHVVIDDRTVRPEDVRGYVRYLRELYTILERKRLLGVWYGTIFIRCKDCGGVNPYGKHLGVAGDYPIMRDVVNVYDRPGPFIVELLAHELGHRYWFKKGNEELRARFKREVKLFSPKPLDIFTELDISVQQTTGVGVAYSDVLEAVGRVGKKALEQSLGDSNLLDDLRYIWSELLEATYQLRARVDNAIYSLVKFAVAGKVGMEKADAFMIKSLGWGRNSQLPKTPSRVALDGAMEAARQTTLYTASAPFDIFNELLTVTRPERRKIVFDQAVSESLKKTATLSGKTAGLAEKAIELAFTKYNVDLTVERAEKIEAHLSDPRAAAVSEYGNVSISEAFAEVFAHYVVGRDLTRPQIRTFTALFPGREGFSAGRTRGRRVR